MKQKIVISIDLVCELSSAVYLVNQILQVANIDSIDSLYMRDEKYNTYINISTMNRLRDELNPTPAPKVDEAKEKESLVLSMFESAHEQKTIEEGSF
jgi:hypothetical protein